VKRNIKKIRKAKNNVRSAIEILINKAILNEKEKSKVAELKRILEKLRKVLRILKKTERSMQNALKVVSGKRN